jgi:probable HAF family extracellular repeat protein
MLNRKFLSAASVALAIGLLVPVQSSAATIADLGTLGGTDAYATVVSADGSVIIGNANLANGNNRAFKYIGTTMTDLGTLGGSNSYSEAVSANGLVIVGWADLANGDYHAFKHVGTTMTDLGTLAGGTYSSAYGVSADGSVIITKIDTATLHYPPLKYVGTTMTDLGTLGGNNSNSQAVSADGSVLIGNSDLANGDSHAFKYVGSTMTDLGTLGGNNSNSQTVSANGLVIIGSSTLVNGDWHAFKYVGTTMTDLGTLGGNSSSAYGVSADGSVIVGSSNVANGERHSFVYTDTGMVDVVEWMQSITGPAGILPIVSSLTSLPMEGAHHRPLMSLDSMGKKTQSWVTGDFGARSRTSDSHTSSGEAGVSSTFNRVMAGLAVGYSEQNNDLLFGGSSNISGQYILGEVDMRLSDNKSILSVTAMLGNWKSNTLRGYGVGGGGVDYSLGSTSLNSTSVRLRIDGAPRKLIRGPWITPFASFTWSRTSADAYDENGGSYDAHFNRQSHVSKEGRLGVSTNFKLGKDTTLLTTLEWIHRFDKSESGFSGTDIDHGALPFTVSGAAIHSNQARLGLDVDHKVNPTTMLNFSAHVTSVGEAPDVSTALSLRRAF